LVINILFKSLCWCWQRRRRRLYW